MTSQRDDRLEAVKRDLERSSRALLSGEEEPKLLTALLSRYPGLKRAYVVGWIPEQFEDIYTIAIDPGLVVVIELERQSESLPVRFEEYALDEYLRNQRLGSESRDLFAAVRELLGRSQ